MNLRHRPIPIVGNTLAWLRCSTCRLIHPDPALFRADVPCSGCGAKGEARETFPTATANRLACLVERAYLDADAEERDSLAATAAEISKVLEREVTMVQAYRARLKARREYVRRQHHERMFAVLARYFHEPENRGRELWQVFFNGKDRTNHSPATACIMFITLVEVLLNELLVHCLITRGSSRRQAHGRVARLGRFQDRFEMFAELTGTPFRDAVLTVRKPFWDAFAHVRRRRNKFVHGNPWALSWRLCERAYGATLIAIPTFAELNNRFALGKGGAE